MDERRQGIADLKKRIENYGRSLDAARETLGAAALSSPLAGSVLTEDIAEGKRLERDLAEARANAKSIEDDTARLQELQLSERDKKLELEINRKDLFELRTRLGEAALSSATPPATFAPFRDRIDALAARVQAQEDRIAELETADEGGGLIAHIGRSARSARSALLRSSLAARRAEGRRILADAGAELASTDAALSSEDEEIRSAAEALTSHSAAVDRGQAELSDIQAAIKELRARLSLGIASNNPRRAIAHLDRLIAEGAGLIATLRRGIGSRLLAVADGEGAGGKRKDPFADFASGLLSDPAISGTLQQARADTESIAAAQRQIEKLEASLRIDVLSSELAGLRAASADHERRIAASTRALAELALRIEEREEEIATLTTLSKGR